MTTYLNVSPFGRNNKGEKYCRRGRSSQRTLCKSVKDLNLPQAAFIAGLPQSPIVYTPYTNTGALKDDLSLGMKRKDFVLFSMYREKLFRKRNMKKPKLTT